MKNLTALLTMTTLLSTGVLQAQTTGETAVATAQTATSNQWQNWTFAASAMATAAGAIFVVSMHNGNASSSH